MSPRAGTSRKPDPGEEPPVKRGPGRTRLLTHERIARAAFDLVDAEGAAALTINRLATDLGVGTMTVYGYASSKDDIVAMLPDVLLEDLPGVDLEAEWQQAIEELYASVYRRLIDHHHVTQVIVDSPAFGRAQAQVLEGVLECLMRAGFSPEEAFALQRTVATYTVGFSLFAIAELQAGAARPRKTWVTELDAEEFPRIAEFAPRLAAQVDEDEYRRSLRRILAGYAD